MADLMKMFKSSVPQAVRKRATEMLDLVKTSQTALHSPAPASVAVLPPQVPDVVMDESNVNAVVDNQKSLWGKGTIGIFWKTTLAYIHPGNNSVSTSSSSSLFGQAKTVAQIKKPIPTTMQSALLGNVQPRTSVRSTIFFRAHV